MTILPANLPNVVLAGVADSLYGLKITYGAYLLMNFPVLGALKALVLVAVICFFFNDPIADPATDAGPATGHTAQAADGPRRPGT